LGFDHSSSIVNKGGFFFFFFPGAGKFLGIVATKKMDFLFEGKFQKKIGKFCQTWETAKIINKINK
jgi:hypothetical protein